MRRNRLLQPCVLLFTQRSDDLDQRMCYSNETADLRTSYYGRMNTIDAMRQASQSTNLPSSIVRLFYKGCLIRNKHAYAIVILESIRNAETRYLIDSSLYIGEKRCAL